MYDEHALAAKFDLKEWKRIFPYLKPYKKEIYTLIVCAVFASFVDAVYPLMTRYAINNFIEPKTLQGIVPFVLVFVATATLQAFYGSVIYSQKAIKIEMGIGRDMRYKLFRHVQELSVDYFNVTPVGFILARIMNDTNSMGGMFSWRLAAIVLQAAYLVFVMVNMLVLNFKLGIMVLAVMVLMATIVFLVQKKLIALNRTARRQNAKITAAYNEYITGAQTVKSLSAEQLICGEFFLAYKLYLFAVRFFVAADNVVFLGHEIAYRHIAVINGLNYRHDNAADT
jgi:ATP-binding cassette subfamily B protein